MCQFCSAAAQEKKSRKMLMYLTALVFGMVSCSYVAVPLYRRFCQATGYGGTVQHRESVEEKIARHSKDGTFTTREIVVQFNADVADRMPWKFVLTQREGQTWRKRACILHCRKLKLDTYNRCLHIQCYPHEVHRSRYSSVVGPWNTMLAG